MKTSLSILACVAGLAQVAAAQTPSFSYSFDAPAVLAPGATATITVLCGFTPGAGQLVQTSLGLLPVLGLESGGFSIAGSGGAWSGLSLIAPVNFVLHTPWIVAGSNVNGVIYGTGFVPPAIPSTVNPTPVWRATFTMPASNVTLTLTGNGNHFLWAQHPQFAVTTNGVTATGAQVTILVPGPASLSLGAFSVLIACRRGRRGGDKARATPVRRSGT